MPEILTESFCERCGTRYTFEAAEPKGKRLGKLKVLSKGFVNFVQNDETSFDEAFAEARSDEQRELTNQQLDAFHQTFQFCMSCRQYTCANCWNEVESRCLSCAPHLGTDILDAPFRSSDPLARILGEPTAPAHATNGNGSNGSAAVEPLMIQPPAEVSAPTDPFAWPSADLIADNPAEVAPDAPAQAATPVVEPSMEPAVELVGQAELAPAAEAATMGDDSAAAAADGPIDDDVALAVAEAARHAAEAEAARHAAEAEAARHAAEAEAVQQAEAERQRAAEFAAAEAERTRQLEAQAAAEADRQRLTEIAAAEAARDLQASTDLEAQSQADAAAADRVRAELDAESRRQAEADAEAAAEAERQRAAQAEADRLALAAIEAERQRAAQAEADRLELAAIEAERLQQAEAERQRQAQAAEREREAAIAAAAAAAALAAAPPPTVDPAPAARPDDLVGTPAWQIVAPEAAPPAEPWLLDIPPAVLAPQPALPPAPTNGAATPTNGAGQSANGAGRDWPTPATTPPPQWPMPVAGAAPEWPNRPTQGAEAMWAASSQDVVSREGTGVQSCVSCGLALSSSARFCRRCGTSQH